jgi:CheY-like chemotaxis protein
VRVKRALIVDDSKSARVVLSRVLEKLELAVDTTESAESALHYLRDHRPDVIFMDHVMSGMDGLQAVQAIKSDPATASIPIMMYTSQDGELYAGEARALGAAGVLPKLMAPADISRVLDELEILRDPRDAKLVSFEQIRLPEAAAAGSAAAIAADPVVAAPPVAPSAAALAAALAPLMREQGTDLRRFVVATLESFSSRVVTDLGVQVESAAVRAANRAAEAVAAATPPPAPRSEPPRARASHGWIALAASAVLAAGGSGAYAWQQHDELGALRDTSMRQSRELTAAYRELAALRAAPAAPAAPAATAGGRLLVPYGEAPLAGDRLAALGKLLADLEQRGIAAAVTVTSYAGDFCLTGNPAEGYAPAPGEMPANRCDVVGNPFDEALPPELREPAALTALVGAARTRATAPVEVRVHNAGRQGAAVGYPAADVSAAQWNAVASNRNYVEFAVEPRPRSP